MGAINLIWNMNFIIWRNNVNCEKKMQIKDTRLLDCSRRTKICDHDHHALLPRLLLLQVWEFCKTSTNVGRFFGFWSQQLVMQHHKSFGQSLGKGGIISSSFILAWRITCDSLVKGTSLVKISKHTIAKLHTSAFGGKFKASFACFGSWLNTYGVAYTIVPFCVV